jgi:5-oxoprolinase (ATP-hydrolysing)
VERWLRFLAPQTVCLLSSSRRVPPFALAGGQPGATGQNAVRRLDGTWQPLPGCAQVEMAAGEVLRIATPGGGGAGIEEQGAERVGNNHEDRLPLEGARGVAWSQNPRGSHDS